LVEGPGTLVYQGLAKTVAYAFVLRIHRHTSTDNIKGIRKHNLDGTTECTGTKSPNKVGFFIGKKKAKNFLKESKVASI